MINDKLNAWNGAIVRLTNKLTGDTIVDSAAHVFETVDGFAYLNPDYFYPETSQLNNYHRFDGVLTEAGEAIQFEGPEWSAYIEEWEATVEQQQQAGTARHCTITKTSYKN